MTSELVERLRFQGRYGHETQDQMAARKVAERLAAADEIERLTAQLAEARQAERAAEDRAWEQARELVRGTNADMCKTARQAYRIICGDMTNAVNNRQLRTLQGRVEARSAARKTGEPA